MFEAAEGYSQGRPVLATDDGIDGLSQGTLSYELLDIAVVFEDKMNLHVSQGFLSKNMYQKASFALQGAWAIAIISNYSGCG